MHICAYSSGLDEEWTQLVSKKLKGADPAEKLTWHTADIIYDIYDINHCSAITGVATCIGC